MKQWLVNNKHAIGAAAAAILFWFALSQLVVHTVGSVYLDIAAYFALGWYWLGGVVVPYIEQKLKQLW